MLALARFCETKPALAEACVPAGCALAGWASANRAVCDSACCSAWAARGFGWGEALPFGAPAAVDSLAFLALLALLVLRATLRLRLGFM